jgi:hypothetical protein
MTDLKVMYIIRDVLQTRDKWYLDHSITDDCSELQEIAEKAKEHADIKLSKISALGLYSRYKKWRKSDPFIADDDKYFHAFLSRVAFELGMKALVREERLMYDECVSITFKTI